MSGITSSLSDSVFERSSSLSDSVFESCNPSSSTSSTANATVVSIPSPKVSDVSCDSTDTVEVQDEQTLMEWLKKMGLENDIEKNTIRILRRGPFRDFLYNFCVPYVRSKTWISTMRLNVDMIAERHSSKEELSDESVAQAEAEIEAYEKELEALEEEEVRLIDDLKEKYVCPEGTLEQALELPEVMKTKMKHERELQYLKSLKKSAGIRRKLSQALSSSFDPKDVNESRLAEELDQLQGSQSIRALTSVVCKIVPKFIGDDDNEDLKVGIKKLKQVIQDGLVKLNFANVEKLVDLSKTTSKSTIAKFPANEFTSGLSEYNKIICDKLLELSMLHIDLHEANRGNCDGYFDHKHNQSVVETPLRVNDYYGSMDECAYLKLLIEEDKAITKLGFYQQLKLEDYEKLIQPRPINRTPTQNGVLPKPTANTSRRIDAGALQPVSGLPNYEVLLDRMLRSIPSTRDEINDGMQWAKSALEGEIEQYFDKAMGFINEDLLPLDTDT